MSDTKLSEAAPIAWVDIANWRANIEANDCFFTDFQDEDTVPVYLHPQPAELAEQQGDGLDALALRWTKRAERLEEDAREADSIGDMPNTVLVLERRSAELRQVIREFEAALAATGKQQGGDVQGDMFWLAVDGERMGYSVEELIDGMCDGEEVEIQTAAQLPNFWVRVKAGYGGSVDFDVIDQRDAAPGVGNG